MKRAVLITCGGLLLTTPLMADQMVVELGSGNKVVVEYSGTIHKVSMEGAGDTIASLNMVPDQQSVGAVSDGPNMPETPKKPSTATPSEENGVLKLKWADPKIED